MRSELAVHIENSIKKIYYSFDFKDDKDLLNNLINTYISISDDSNYEFNRIFTQSQVFIEYLTRFKMKILKK